MFNVWHIATGGEAHGKTPAGMPAEWTGYAYPFNFTEFHRSIIVVSFPKLRRMPTG
jgi:hypothetical protein